MIKFQSMRITKSLPNGPWGSRYWNWAKYRDTLLIVPGSYSADRRSDQIHNVKSLLQPIWYLLLVFSFARHRGSIICCPIIHCSLENERKINVVFRFPFRGEKNRHRWRQGRLRRSPFEWRYLVQEKLNNKQLSTRFIMKSCTANHDCKYSKCANEFSCSFEPSSIKINVRQRIKRGTAKLGAVSSGCNFTRRPRNDN